ncbi:MAG TPA: glycerol-3-phosphate dehydrogenase [Hyphomicrobiaceae bacterium]|nr:glycerol-3-phosphate dehydrogenase [Hyphomicrobiaceae bacterium]
MQRFDLLVIGGGINGVGIAADAAGRGLRVLLVEKGDLGGATSSSSSKLIHGGLRYLEHYEFRLVRAALAEREVLMRRAPHIIWPLRFVLPHVTGLRPKWMIRLGLALYDNLARRKAIPGSTGLDLAVDPAAGGLKPGLERGFAYWDCWVDDARLVILNAIAAKAAGAEIATRTELMTARPDGGRWIATLAAPSGSRTIEAAAIVNATGPWVESVGRRIAVARGVAGAIRNDAPHVRLVKGSHVVVPRFTGTDSAFLLQSSDGRVVFVLPFEDHFSLIGTTDVPIDGDPGAATPSDAEVHYLLTLVGRFFRSPPTPADIVWRFAGVRPLVDDESANPSAASRDWRLELSPPGAGGPLLSVIGGKVTTFRRLAEAALERLAPHLPPMRPAWTATATLPGGDIPSGGPASYAQRLAGSYPAIDARYLALLARRYGSRAHDLLGDASTPADLGERLGPALSEREVRFLVAEEWAATPDDILWRRTKAGLHVAPAERTDLADRVARLI